MVGKGIILLGIQSLQKGRRRIAPEIHTDFINFVQHKYGVFRPCIFNALDYSTRQCPYIGSAVAAYLRLIMDSPQRNSDKFTVQRTGYRFTDRSFADTRRADETKNRAFDFSNQLMNGQVLQNSFLYLGQSVVILI